MPVIYSISDIHGNYEAMIDTLELVDLDSDKNHKLILLGDYVDRGTESCQVLYYIKKLEEQYPEQVIILLGNHDQMFIEWLTLKDELHWLAQEDNVLTVKSFFSEEQFNDMMLKMKSKKDTYSKISEYLAQELKSHHASLVNWFVNKNEGSLFYETDDQIYVHAGIYEVDETLWKHATEPSEFTWKYPAEIGYFYKDIIAGHNASAMVAEDISYLGKVYWDRQSHFFIDGDTPESNSVPLLKFDVDTGEYSSYYKQLDGSWTEYQITKKNKE